MKLLAVLAQGVCVYLGKCSCVRTDTENLRAKWFVRVPPSLPLRGKLCWNPPSLRDGLDGLVPPGMDAVFHGSPPSLSGVGAGDIPRGAGMGKGEYFLQALQQCDSTGLS